MIASKAALLIGGISHARKEWEALGSLLILKVCLQKVSSRWEEIADVSQEYQSGSREDFLSKIKAGEYDDVVAIYRSNDSTSVTGPFDKELLQSLPKSLKYINHNGAGYDNIDIAACTAKGVEVSSTPIAVNEATADGEP